MYEMKHNIYFGKNLKNLIVIIYIVIPNTPNVISVTDGAFIRGVPSGTSEQKGP